MASHSEFPNPNKCILKFSPETKHIDPILGWLAIRFGDMKTMFARYVFGQSPTTLPYLGSPEWPEMAGHSEFPTRLAMASRSGFPNPT